MDYVENVLEFLLTCSQKDLVRSAFAIHCIGSQAVLCFFYPCCVYEFFLRKIRIASPGEFLSFPVAECLVTNDRMFIRMFLMGEGRGAGGEEIFRGQLFRHLFLLSQRSLDKFSLVYIIHTRQHSVLYVVSFFVQLVEHVYNSGFGKFVCLELHDVYHVQSEVTLYFSFYLFFCFLFVS